MITGACQNDPFIDFRRHEIEAALGAMYEKPKP
jgi:hypothetical protein